MGFRGVWRLFWGKQNQTGPNSFFENRTLTSWGSLPTAPAGRRWMGGSEEPLVGD